MVERFRIDPVRTPEDLAAVASLLRAYAASLSVDLAYQDFAAELAGLPGGYAPPAGELLLARGEDGAALGCAGLRPAGEAGIVEMKRLYVRQQGRRLGLGAALVAEIVAVAERIGCREIRLDTLPDMGPAIVLYERSGFVRTEPYCDTPIARTVFFVRRIGGPRVAGQSGQTAA